MTHERTNQMPDRLRRSKTARAAVLLAGLAVAGCASSNAAGNTVDSGKANVAVTSTPTPGTRPAEAATSTAPLPETGTVSRANWCKAASVIVATAFEDPHAASECEVLPPSSTPGDILVRWTLNSFGVTGYLVEASVLDFPFNQVTSGAKPTTTRSGTEVVVVPNSTLMYVNMPANSNETGELEVLSGEGGITPLNIQDIMKDAADVFDVFDNTSNASLYPTGSP